MWAIKDFVFLFGMYFCTLHDAWLELFAAGVRFLTAILTRLVFHPVLRSLSTVVFMQHGAVSLRFEFCLHASTVHACHWGRLHVAPEGDFTVAVSFTP